MKLNEFKELSGIQMCEQMNRHMENHTARNFKDGNMEFTFAQAEKALQEQGVLKVSGVYRTEDEMLSLLQKKKKERDKKELSQENIEQLLDLLEPDKYKKLLLLTEKYDYVSSYILRADTGVKIRDTNGTIKTTSIRVYDETLERWKEFIKENSSYKAIDLLNTALIEFMERYGKQCICSP